MKTSPGLPATDLSRLPSLLAALLEALNADLEIDELSLLLFVAFKRGVPALDLVGSRYKRPRESLRKSGLIVWCDGLVILTLTGQDLVGRVAGALASKSDPQPKEVASA